jgi:hypothetical protein
MRDNKVRSRKKGRLAYGCFHNQPTTCSFAYPKKCILAQRIYEFVWCCKTNFSFSLNCKTSLYACRPWLAKRPVRSARTPEPIAALTGLSIAAKQGCIPLCQLGI